MTIRQILKLTAMGGLMAILAACQTTRQARNEDFKEYPIEESAFNVALLSSLPVTKLEKTQTDNGQIQVEKFTFGCNESHIVVQHVFNVWFTESTRQKLSEPLDANSLNLGSNIKITKTTNLAGGNRNMIGYLYDFTLPGESNCQHIRAGMRMIGGDKGYAGDTGTPDTIITGLYCPQSPLNIEEILKDIRPVSDRQAYLGKLATRPKMACQTN